MIIRPARPEEFSLLPDIESDAAQAFRNAGLDEIDGLEATPASWYENMPGRNTVYVAEDNGKVIGFIAGHEGDGQAYLREVSVRYSYSGRGVGAALIKALMSWAREAGFTCMTLTTFRDIPFNAPFYEKLGFKPFKPDNDWQHLLEVREKERQEGLDIAPRICMKLDLDEQK